jgi:hypothetical protein
LKTKRKDNDIEIYDDYAEIILRNRQYEEVGRAIVDLADLELLRKYKWYLNRINNFVYADTGSNSLYMHRLLMDVVHIKNIYVDHINHNRLDNRRKNIRVCSNMENSRNQIKQSGRSSNIIGVSWNKGKNKWHSYIWVNYKRINLGKYKVIEEAIIVRLQAELKYFGEFAPQKHLFGKYKIIGDKGE